MDRDRPRWIDALLGVPLAHKLVISSVAVAAFSAGVVALAARSVAQLGALPDGVLAAAAFLLGVLLLGALNGVLVRLALRPISDLERAAGRVERGDLSARAGDTPLADPHLRRVIGLFNGALEGVSELRRRLRAVARRAVERRERERRELAGRLQEDVAQRVAACLVTLQVARGSGSREEREERLEEVRNEAAAVLECVRRIARELHPPELSDIGLERAVRAYARTFAESTGLRVEVRVGGAGATTERGLDERARLTLYRAAQELLMNVVQHADGSGPVRLWLRSDEGAVAVELEEGGRRDGGSRREGDAGSFPLVDLRERLAWVGGAVTVRATDGGYLVRAEVPRAADPMPGASEGSAA